MNTLIKHSNSLEFHDSLSLRQNGNRRDGIMTVEATVYLVEDDDAVRDSLQMVLESVGH